MEKYFVLFLVFLNLGVRAADFREFRVFEVSDVCEISTGVRIYVDFGHSGQLRNSGVESNNLCFFTLVTCPSCSIRLSWAPEDPNRCEKFLIVEPPYNVVREKYICDPQREYVSKTRALSLQIPAESTNATFTFFYESLRNIVEISESSGESTRTIQSPFFPAVYSRDFIVDYNISCLRSDCRIRIIFTDFQLALISTVEFFDVNQERFQIYSGAFFRPPVIFSPNSSIRIRFSANGGSDLGFRANVTFFPVSEATNPMLNPNINCGGSVSSLGGAISMMNMVSEEENRILYDCIWIVRPSSRYFHQQDQLLLRVDSFSKMGDSSELTVHRGMTSTHPEVLKIVGSEANSTEIGENLIGSISSGFYVHLRGFFRQDSRLVIVYAAFGIRDCYIGTGFMCKNRRCIAIELRCDGFDHCGDSSDETQFCLAENGSDWNTHANYFFPKADTYDDENFRNFRTVSILLMICSFGFVILIIFFLFYRVNSRRARHQRNLQNHLQTISDLLDQNTIPVQEVIVDEPPPNYEAPPEYEDVIKVGMEYEIRRSKRRSRGHSKRRRSESRKLSIQRNPAHLDVEEEIISIVTTSGEASGISQCANLGDRMDCVGKSRMEALETPEASSEAEETKDGKTISCPTLNHEEILLLRSKSEDFQ
ncbi:uncharacterized protein LOC129800613 isoform X2 [Phlebotomus papatasi]|uniref:uncharacterized protein LOC129800613 isoform X2 n=1 Tax=Phlebotomus papatasi TaxID=29031 RepID=UPI002483BC76|nr:uncharacterized protein LOC129800613 isoform X2 [Phlebotomus papatasi]